MVTTFFPPPSSGPGVLFHTHWSILHTLFLQCTLDTRTGIISDRSKRVPLSLLVDVNVADQLDQSSLTVHRITGQPTIPYGCITFVHLILHTQLQQTCSAMTDPFGNVHHFYMHTIICTYLFSGESENIVYMVHIPGGFIRHMDCSNFTSGPSTRLTTFRTCSKEAKTAGHHAGKYGITPTMTSAHISGQSCMPH